MRRIWLAPLLLLALLPIPAFIPSATAAAAGTGISTDGLLFAYDAANFNSYQSSNGNQLYDLSGNNKTATLVNSPTHYRNSSGSYFLFDGGPTGSASDYIDVPDILAGTDFKNGTGSAVGAGFSFSFYGSFGAAASSFERIFDFGGGSTTNNIWFGRYIATNDVKIETWNGASLIGSVTSNTAPITTGLQQWTVVMASTGTNIYLNGTSIASTNSDIRPVAAERKINYIGQSNWGDTFFEGSIYRIAFYNKALTSSQISQNYTSMVDLAWPSLTGAYSFNVNENTSSVASLTASETAQYFEYTGSGDYSKFSITTDGVVTFDASPNYEAPNPSNSLNYYFYLVDSNGNYQLQVISIAVLNVNEYATLTAPSLSATPYKGVNVTITVTPATAANTPGKVTFLWNGKRIPKCFNKVYSGSSTITCIWKPASTGYEQLSVTFTPNKTAGGIQEYAPATSTLTPFVAKRSTTR